MRRTVTGFVALAAATLAVQVIGFFVLAVLARRLGPDGLGSYNFAVNLVGYFAIPANFGVIALAVRELARDPDRARPVAGEVVALQTVLALLPYALLVALAPALAVDADSRRLIPIIGLAFLFEVWSLQWMLYASQRFVVAAVARLAGTVAYAVLVLALISDQGDDVLTLGWIHIAGVVVTTVLALAAVLRAVGRPRFRFGLRGLVRRFRLGVPLGVASVMISVYYTADALMLGWLRDPATVGQYAVAYKLPFGILAFAALWGGVLFPHFSALAQRSRTELREQLGFFASISLVVSLPLLAGAIIVGPELVPQLFGAQYAPAGTPFVLLMGAAALVLFTVNLGTTAVAAGDERHYAIAVSLGAALNVVVNLLVIPPFGMIGAACATIAAEVAVFAYVAVRVRRLVGPTPLERERIVRAATATAAMTAVLLVLPADLGATVKVAVGVVVFVVCALSLRVVHVAELRRLVPSG
jgi:O-antigen/teichoic acid export membrane protein